ncbi:MAG: GNAT family N-acetyltransferase [Chloroflexi bacterium]|nr:GNAT family N-acetyltransferase [Chloroflexota bacterium]
MRDADEADLPRIVELLAQLSLDATRERLEEPLPASYLAAFEEIIADQRQRLLVIETQGRIAGSAVLIIVPNLSHQGRPYAIIENIVVDTAARGAGSGETLVRYAIEEARKAGCYKLSLTSNKRRPDAHRFYERLGFQATHEGYRLEF